ncbi:MAG: FAD-binding oxidoreductase [Silicimonas sp.]|nr:FAD-binding oxidoreductase [Silicimonas sp.]
MGAGSLFTDDANPGAPYWWEAVDWPTLDAPPPGKVDLLVIGAGYTGLSAAIAAHDAGAKVAVLDAGIAGQGASSRNGGMVGPHPKLSWEALAKDFGDDTADEIFKESGEALFWVRDLIAHEGIDCDFQTTGRIQLAYTSNHFEAQKALAAKVGEKSAVDCRILEKDELKSEIVTPMYKGGMVFSEHGALHPAKYHRGLLEAVLRRSIPVSAPCAAEDVTRLSGSHRIRTPKGEVRADKVVLATNGYTTRPFSWFMARVFPVPSFLIATEPLSPNLIGEIAPGCRMMVETRARRSYFRISPDGSRIIFGGRAALVDIAPARAARWLRDTMCQIWPTLEGTRLSHVWSGYTGFSFGQMPVVGERNGLHYALGYSGSGTVMAPYLGAKAAWQSLGLSKGDTAFSRTRLDRRWYHRGSAPHFLKAGDLWYRHWVDRRENLAARR